MRLFVLAALSSLAIQTPALAQSISTADAVAMLKSGAAPSASAAPATATRVAFTNPKPPSEVKVSKKRGQSWTCQVAYDDGFAFCSVKFTDADGRRMQYPNTVRFYDLYGRMLAGPPATYAKYTPSAQAQPVRREAFAAIDGAHEKVSGGLEHEPTREAIVTQSADGKRVYAASYEKKPSLFALVAGGVALDIAHGFAAHLAYGSYYNGYGYYGTGDHYRATNYYNPNDACGYPPGYTGPMYRLSCDR